MAIRVGRRVVRRETSSHGIVQQLSSARINDCTTVHGVVLTGIVGHQVPFIADFYSNRVVVWHPVQMPPAVRTRVFNGLTDWLCKNGVSMIDYTFAARPFNGYGRRKPKEPKGKVGFHDEKGGLGIMPKWERAMFEEPKAPGE